MNLEVFENRNNSLADYSIYLNELKKVTIGKVIKGDITMDVFNYVSSIADDIEQLKSVKP